MVAEEAVGEPDVGAMLADGFKGFGESGPESGRGKGRQAKADDGGPEEVVSHARPEFEAQAHKSCQAKQRGEACQIVPGEFGLDAREQVPARKEAAHEETRRPLHRLVELAP